MDPLWMLWLATGAVGPLLGVVVRASAQGRLFDGLLLFLLASLVCDGLAALSVIDGWRLNPYAISVGFALGAMLRDRLSGRAQAQPSA